VWRTATCEQCGSEIERNSFPELPKADDEYTPKQRRIVDAQLAEGLADIKAGRVQGPFPTYKEFIASLHKEARKLSGKTKRSA
jgi:hypothetical protein